MCNSPSCPNIGPGVAEAPGTAYTMGVPTAVLCLAWALALARAYPL